jgi:hypothetical protein
LDWSGTLIGLNGEAVREQETSGEEPSERTDGADSDFELPPAVDPVFGFNESNSNAGEASGYYDTQAGSDTGDFEEPDGG